MGCGISTMDAEKLAREYGTLDVPSNSPPRHAGDHENGKDDDHVRPRGRRSISSPITKIRNAKGRRSNANHRDVEGKEKKVPKRYEEEEDEEGSLDSEEARKITFRDDHVRNCPGSPSFREYCVHYESSLNDSFDDDSDEAKKPAGKDADVWSHHQKRGSGTKTEKKSRRGRGIRLVLPRRGNHHE